MVAGGACKRNFVERWSDLVMPMRLNWDEEAV